jgi:predicted dehydrogenase
VKVPRHRELVLPALAAGKPVLCEWPLANGVAEAEELVEAAAGVRNFVGLQGTASPATRYLQDLLAQGYVGEIVSSSILAASMPWGGPITTAASYLMDKANGATLLSIVYGHLSDAVHAVVGAQSELVATTATRYPTVLNVDTGEQIPQTAEDHIAVTGTLEGGAVSSVHLRGANPHATQLLWEITGTEGDLIISGPGATLSSPVTIKGAKGRDELVELPIPAEYDRYAALAGTPAHAVAHAYDRIREDLTTGSHTAPDFAHGLARHRLLAAIEKAAAEGRRQRV